MAGEVDPFEPQSGAAPDLEIDQGEADRDAEAPVEHLVQEAVAGIVVVIAIAAEPELFVEVGVERRDPHRGRRPLMALEPSGRRLAHPLEAQQVRRRVERGIFDAGDRQRRGREGFARLVQRAQEIVGDAGQARQQRQWHGAIVARTHPITLIDRRRGVQKLDRDRGSGIGRTFLQLQLPAFSFSTKSIVSSSSESTIVSASVSVARG